MSTEQLKKPEHNCLIVGIDPGTTTGVVLCRLDTTPLPKPPVLIIDQHSQFPDFRYLHEFIESCDIVIYERFIGSSTVGVQLSPLEVIGVVKYLCVRNGVPLYGFLPSEKRFVDHRYGAQLKSLKSLRVHERDALRHVCLYLHKTGFRDFRIEV